MNGQPTTLWVSNVGSHLWRMNRPDSDVDLFKCYVVPTRSLLSGEVSSGGTHFSHGDLVDVQSHEVGAWVEQLLKMNPNYLFGLFSPIVLQSRGIWLTELRALVLDGLSRQVCAPIRGMMLANRIKYIDKGADPSEARLNKICRVGVFGVKLLSRGVIEFEPFAGGTPQKVNDLLQELSDTCALSLLPATCPNEPAIRDWLLRLRLTELEGRL